MQKHAYKIGSRLAENCENCVKFNFDFLNLEKTTLCVLRFFSYSFTAHDGSEESTAGRVVSPCSIMMHHGFRSKEASRARKQKMSITPHHSPHCWLPAKVMYPANSTEGVSWLTRSTSILLKMNVQIYIYIYVDATSAMIFIDVLRITQQLIEHVDE